MLKGYIYNEDGFHNGYQLFEEGAENIANFIMYNNMHPVVITDELDNFIVSSTAGGFLDRVVSPELRAKIIEKILPLQMRAIAPYNPVSLEHDEIREFAKELDDFALSYDYYNYQDEVEDRDSFIETLAEDIRNNDVDAIIEYLQEIIEEENYDDEFYGDEAKRLLKKISKIVKETNGD